VNGTAHNQLKMEKLFPNKFTDQRVINICDQREKSRIQPTVILTRDQRGQIDHLQKPNSTIPFLRTEIENQMIPIPYYPYSYFNCEFRSSSDPKDSAMPPQQIPYGPYILTQPLPGLVPNFSDVPATQMPVPGMIGPPRSPPFMTPNPPIDAPLFGPGPPIITGERLKGPRGCNLFVFHLPNEITNW
jgi:hypothetical protein